MKTPIKVVALFGPSGSGKDFILNEFLKRTSSYKQHRIVSWTTRPKREGEEEGVVYNFRTSDNFMKKKQNGEFLECTNFKDWLYGTPIENLDANAINFGIFNIQGIRSLLADDRVEVYPVYIHTKSKTRLIRQLNREENPDIDEIIRRYSADKKDFADIDFNYYTIQNSTITISRAADLLSKYVNQLL